MDRRTFIAAGIQFGLVASVEVPSSLVPSQCNPDHSFFEAFGRGIALELDALLAMGGVIGRATEKGVPITRAARREPLRLQAAVIASYREALRHRPGDPECSDCLVEALRVHSSMETFQPK